MMDSMGSSAAELLANEAFVRRLARSLAADEAGADDLVQETWLAALQSRACGRSGLRAWLARVLRNLAASGLRGRVRREARESACASPESQPDTAELVARVELHHRLVAAVLGLPEAYREVLLRHYLRGESVRSLAASLGRPEATVRTRLRRARDQLRRELGGRLCGEQGAALAILGTLEPATRWTSEWLMKKSLLTNALLQTPLIVGGFLGAGLGFGGSLLLRGEPGDGPPASPLLAQPAAASTATPDGEWTAERARTASPASSRVPVPPRTDPGWSEPSSMTGDDLRRLLLSSDRLDQVRAIRLLAEESTPEAHALLLETFMTTDDEILLAMLEEALLDSDQDVSSIVLESYRTSLDPERLQRLTSMMLELLERNPALEPAVIELLVGALREPGPQGERLAGLGLALVALGESALDAITEYLSDPLSDPRGVQAAAHALAEIDPLAAEEVQERLGQTFDALIEALGDASLDDERRRALLERTSSMAWAAANRPGEEHDSLSALLAERLFRATDQQQAQTLAWGITSLESLSDQARLRVARSILDYLPDQASDDLRQSYVWAVSQLAIGYGTRDLDRSFFEIQRLVQEHMGLHGSGPAFAAQLAWLWHELEKHREEQGG